MLEATFWVMMSITSYGGENYGHATFPSGVRCEEVRKALKEVRTRCVEVYYTRANGKLDLVRVKKGEQKL